MFCQILYQNVYVSDDESSVIDLAGHLEVDSVFSQMQGDLDQQRLLGERPVSSVDPFLLHEIHNKERLVRSYSSPILIPHRGFL